MKALVIGLMALVTIALAADLVLIQPADVVARVSAKDANLVILQVGPNVLYRAKHISGSIYGGFAARPDGLESIKAAVQNLPRGREIVIYCGCCPWSHCPNVKPAFELLKQMGFTRVKAMYVETNFAKDWVDKGYPVESSRAGQ